MYSITFLRLSRSSPSCRDVAVFVFHLFEAMTKRVYFINCTRTHAVADYGTLAVTGFFSGSITVDKQLRYYTSILTVRNMAVMMFVSDS